MHFVHVLSDDRAQTTALGDSKSCSYFDATEDDMDLGELVRRNNFQKRIHGVNLESVLLFYEHLNFGWPYITCAKRSEKFKQESTPTN